MSHSYSWMPWFFVIDRNSGLAIHFLSCIDNFVVMFKYAHFIITTFAIGLEGTGLRWLWHRQDSRFSVAPLRSHSLNSNLNCEYCLAHTVKQECQASMENMEIRYLNVQIDISGVWSKVTYTYLPFFALLIWLTLQPLYLI